MEIIENWLDLNVNRYEDGKYEAYEALSDSRCVTDNWSVIHHWLQALIDATTLKVAASRDKEEPRSS